MKAVELCRIMQSDHPRPACRLYLRECDGGRVFPIVIGRAEMDEIHRKVHGAATSRPMTHDLLRALMDATGSALERVEITALRDEVFHARMHFSQEGGDGFELDARPSDAIAIATGLGAPLYADEGVLDAVGVIEQAPPSGPR